MAVVSRDVAEGVLSALKRDPKTRQAAIIGEVIADPPGKVLLQSNIGGKRIINLPIGEQLPRIC